MSLVFLVSMTTISNQLNYQDIIEQIENARKETGLTILFITLVNSLTVNTEDVDGVSDGYGGYTFTEVVTGVELDAEYLYTYY